MKKYFSFGQKITVIVILVLGLFFLATVETTAFSPEIRKPRTARILGMGGAFTGVADDAGALLYNPAGLTESSNAGILISGGLLAENPGRVMDDFGLRDFQGFNFGEDREDFMDELPENIDVTGEGLLAFNIGNAAIGGDIKADISGDVSRETNEAEFDYISNRNLRLGLSSDIIRIPAEVGTASYGINLRYNHVNSGNHKVYELEENAENPIFLESEELDGSGLALDGGLILQLTPLVHGGIMIENALAQEITLDGNREVYKYDFASGDWEEDFSEEPRNEPEELEKTFNPERRGRIGVAGYIPVIGTTVTADLENIPLLSGTDDEPVLFLGAENQMIFDTIRLRLGTYSYENRVFTAGAGLNIPAVKADLGAGYSPGGDYLTAQVQVEIGF